MIVWSRRRAPHSSVRLFVLGWSLLAARAVWAQGETATSLAAVSARPLRLLLPNDDPRILEPESLRDQLKTELQRPVLLEEDSGATPDTAVLTISYNAAGNELTVSYSPREGDPVTRTVSPPGAPKEVEPLAVLLAGNVVRDQASELLAPPPSPPIATPTRQVVPASPSGADVSSRLFDLTKNVRTDPEVWAANLSLLNVALHLSGRTAYALIGGSFHAENGRHLLGPVLALGAHLPLPFRRLACESDIGVTYFRAVDSADDVPPGTPVYTATRLISRLRAAAVYSLSPHLALFGGATLALTTHFYGVMSNDFGPELFGGVRL